MLTACVFILSVIIFLVPTVVAFNFLLKWNGVGWGAAVKPRASMMGPLRSPPETTEEGTTQLSTEQEYRFTGI